MRKVIVAFTALALFFAGYITGSIRTRNAVALELGGLSSTVDSLKNLGKTVVEMQDNLNKLQKNVNTVKTIKEDLAKYQGVYKGVTGGGAKKQVTPALHKGLQQILPDSQQQ